MDSAPLIEEIKSITSDYPDAIAGISIRDLSGGESGVAIDINGDREFHAASTMKVPVMIEIFRQAASGAFHLDDSLLVENAFSSIVDGSRYQMDIGEDSDESVYGSIGQTMSIRDLTTQMITWSSNLATNLLIDLVSADSVQETIEHLGTRTMKVRRGVEDIKAYERGLNNTTNSSDLALLLKSLALGEAVSDDADAEMIAILKDQQFKRMIPAGLPDDVVVAHKTGSITRINHDAAIISPDDNPLVLVILVEGLDEEQQAWELGKRVTTATWRFLRSE